MIRRTNSDEKEKNWLRFKLQMLQTEKIKNIFISLNFWVKKMKPTTFQWKIATNQKLFDTKATKVEIKSFFD